MDLEGKSALSLGERVASVASQVRGCSHSLPHLMPPRGASDPSTRPAPAGENAGRGPPSPQGRGLFLRLQLARGPSLPISPARTTAYRILRRVEAGRGFAVDLLQTQEVSALKEADRRLATEIAMGVLRWRGELDFQLEELSGRAVDSLDAEVATILRMGVYQIQFLERVPKAAAVNEAVELTKAAHKRSATGLVNAVLRKCPAGRGPIKPERFDDLDQAVRVSVRHAAPAWLLERWARNFGQAGTAGEEVALRLAWASTQVPPTVLRVVDPAQDITRLREELAAEGIKTRPGRFSERALVVESGNVQASQALGQGRVVIQDEASQLVADLLAPQAGQHVLDLCAAPGIKAGQIAQTLGRGTLVTCDLSASRLRTMARLLPPWLPKECPVAGGPTGCDPSSPLWLPV